jgi:hypothetical protein
MKKSTALKERMKVLRNSSHTKIIVNNDIENKIKILDSQIKNCEYDLNNYFKGNTLIENKLRLIKLQKIELENKKEAEKANFQENLNEKRN